MSEKDMKLLNHTQMMQSGCYFLEHSITLSRVRDHSLKRVGGGSTFRAGPPNSSQLFV